MNVSQISISTVFEKFPRCRCDGCCVCDYLKKNSFFFNIRMISRYYLLADRKI